MLKEQIEQIKAELAGLKAGSQKEAEEWRVRLLGKKGEITQLFEEFRTVAPELKKEFGRTLNELKQTAMAKIAELKAATEDICAQEGPRQDLSMPGDPKDLGPGILCL